jgi:AbrB family looped-hinge helix DNA binding protein
MKGNFMETSIDKFGRVLIPKKVREDLGLHPGEVLRVEEHEREITLKPLRDTPNLVNKEGVLVYSGSASGDIEGTITAHRKKRLKNISSW